MVKAREKFGPGLMSVIPLTANAEYWILTFAPVWSMNAMGGPAKVPVQPVYWPMEPV